MIPTLNHYSNLVSDIPSGRIYLAYLFWHSFYHFIRHLFWHTFWHIFRHSFWNSIWNLFWHSIWHLCRHSIWHLFWHCLWHSFWHMYLAYLLTFFLAFYVYLWRFFVVGVPPGTLWSRGCGSGPVGTAAEGEGGGTADTKNVTTRTLQVGKKAHDIWYITENNTTWYNMIENIWKHHKTKKLK